jgi:hypothetical protein
MKLTGQLNFGANLGFDRLHCVTCGETRLHRYCKCVSCNTLHESGNRVHQSWEKLKPYQTASIQSAIGRRSIS